MHRVGWFAAGVLASVVIAALAAIVWISQSGGFSARSQPTALEGWMARQIRDAALPREAAALKNPVAATPEVLNDARAHWADHCAFCHANDGSGDTEMGRHTYPPAPDMRLPATQRLSDGALFYIIQNGIRLSAMCAWGGGSGHDAEDSWKLVHFIRHLPQLTFEEKQEMQKLNPKGPEDRREEEEEEKFLKGEETHDAPTEHHHH